MTAKNAAKQTLVNATRMRVDVIQTWPQMTNEKRRALNITERGRKPTPSPVPCRQPPRRLSRRYEWAGGLRMNRALPERHVSFDLIRRVG